MQLQLHLNQQKPLIQLQYLNKEQFLHELHLDMRILLLVREEVLALLVKMVNIVRE